MQGIVQHIRELKLAFKPHRPARRARLGGPGWEGPVTAPVRLYQYDDQHYVLQGAEGAGARAPGWGEIDDGQRTLAVALRDFLQQWPKSLEVSAEELAIGLFPWFEEGDYAHVEPWTKHQYRGLQRKSPPHPARKVRMAREHGHYSCQPESLEAERTWKSPKKPACLTFWQSMEMLQM